MTLLGNTLGGTMDLDQLDELKRRVRDVPDFPKKGIIFKDITTLLKDPVAFRASVNTLLGGIQGTLEGGVKGTPVDHVVGIESRGFIFGPVLAYLLGTGFIPVRKKGKLPARTARVSYELEYGSDILEMHEDALKKGDKVLVVDDLLATGGTGLAVAQLINQLGAEVKAFAFLVELTFLQGRQKLSDYQVFSVLKY